MTKYLTDRRKELGLTMKQVAEAVGVSEATVCRWESGQIANMRRDRINNYAKILRVDPNFIMTGEKKANILSGISNIIPIEPMERIPLLGAIACGDPILAQENIEDYIDLPRTIKADFALTCEGDSMIDAGIKDGDVVYIRSQPEVRNGQIAAVLVDGESATLKRFFFNDGVVTLMAANQSYPPIVKAGSDVEQVRVLGLAVGLSRSFFK